ncbi:MAG: creatininase family protein [Aureliella sp.]
MPARSVRPWLLEEVTLADVRQHRYRLAVLPLGATEPHNLHLPYATDSIEAFHLAEACCQAAWQMGCRLVQLPVLPYGTETNMQQFPLAMNIMPSTLAAILGDLVRSLEASGIDRLLIFNSHGGNELKPILRELYGQTRVQIFFCNWFQMIRDVAAEVCDYPEDHAGEMETSMILSFRPELVAHQPDGRLAADSGAVRPFAREALEKGWIGITRPWHLLTTNSGSGNPHAATADKARQLTEAIVERVAPFLTQLAKADLSPPFPFE